MMMRFALAILGAVAAGAHDGIPKGLRASVDQLNAQGLPQEVKVETLIDANDAGGSSATSASGFCNLDTSSIDVFLDPPAPVRSLIMTTLGVGWNISSIESYSNSLPAGGGKSACSDLAGIMNSDKDFVVISVDGPQLHNILMGDAAAEEQCEREKERNENNSCDETTAVVVEKETENPGSVALGSVLPICMGLRFCNDQDEIDGSVKFGFVTRANDNAGITLGMIGPCEIGFKSVAFDTAGGLGFTFATPLINPSGGPLIEQPTGAHFLMNGQFTFPLKKQVGENVELWNLGDAGIDGRFGMYSELTVNGETTADVVRVMGHLGDLEELASGLDRLKFQLFLDATAGITLKLGEIFDIEGGFELSVNAEMSAMLEVQVEAPQRRSWYLGSANQNCNQVCDIHLLHCTDNSMDEVSSLVHDSEALGAFAEAGVMCDGFTVGQNDGRAPFQSPEGCHKPIPRGSMPVCDATGSNNVHPLCYCEDGGTGAVALTESVHNINATQNAARAIHESELWLQNTYVALSASVEFQPQNLWDLLNNTMGEFGHFLYGLRPEPPSGVLVEAGGLAGRFHLKLPLSGAAHFIIQFSVQIDINCDTINNIRNMTNQYGAYIGLSFEDLPGTETINAFCNQESHTIEAVISLGFEGFSVDRVNTFLEFRVSNDEPLRLDYEDFPSCPAPVLTGGSCFSNEQCASSDRDPETTMYAAYDGYCMNDPTWLSSIGCLGTCIEKLSDGGDCSGAALNLNLLDGWDGAHGDDDACESGFCDPATELCASKFADGERCWRDDACRSGRCAAHVHVCAPLLPNDERCWEDEDCASGRCSNWYVCKDKLPLGSSCGQDDDCESEICTWAGWRYTCRNERNDNDLAKVE